MSIDRLLSFGRLVERCRKDVKRSQQALARDSHIHASTISRLENDHKYPTYEELKNLTRALSLYGVASTKLNELWTKAGYAQEYKNGLANSHSDLENINNLYTRLPTEHTKIFSEYLGEITDLLQIHFVAQNALRERRWRSAIERWELVARRRDNIIQQLYLLAEEPVAQSYYSQGDYTEALKHYESALWSVRQIKRLSDSSELDHREGSLLIDLGGVHRRIGGPNHWDIALKCYSQAETLFRQSNNYTRVGACLRKMAGLYLLQGLARKALPYCEESLEIFQGKGDDVGIYKSLQHKGWAYRLLGRWNEATQLLDEALNIIMKVNPDEWELVKGLSYLGDTYLSGGRLSEAQKVYREALNIIEKYKAKGIEAQIISGMIWLGLGKTHLEMQGGEFLAQEYLFEFLKVRQRVKGDDTRLADGLNTLGNLMLKLGRKGEAEKYLRQANELLKTLEIDFYYVSSLVNLCELFYLRRDYELVYRVAEEAKTYTDKIDIDSQLSRIFLIVGQAFIKEEKYLEVGDAFCKSIEHAMYFNEIVFEQILQGIQESIDSIIFVGALESAEHLCKDIEEFWRERRVEPDKYNLVRHLLEKIRHKQKDISFLQTAK